MNFVLKTLVPRASAGLVAAAAMIAAGAAPAAALPAVNATYQNIDYPGASWTDVTGVVTTGWFRRSQTQIVGTFGDINGKHGFLLSGGQYTRLDVPAPYAVNTQAFGINRVHEVIGTYYRADTGKTCDFVYSAGTYTLADPARSGCGPLDRDRAYETFGINDAGDVVGRFDAYYDNSTNTGHYEGFLGTTGSLLQYGYDVAGSHGTVIYGINNNSTPELVGHYQDAANHIHGVVFTGVNPSGAPFNVPGTPATEARGVDDSGRIVGWYRWATSSHGFVDNGGRFTRVDYPGALNTQVNGINNPPPSPAVASATTYLLVGHYDKGYLPGGAPAWHGFVATVSRPPLASGLARRS
jgi:hypothetical protein